MEEAYEWNQEVNGSRKSSWTFKSTQWLSWSMLASPWGCSVWHNGSMDHDGSMEKFHWHISMGSHSLKLIKLNLQEETRSASLTILLSDKWAHWRCNNKLVQGLTQSVTDFAVLPAGFLTVPLTAVVLTSASTITFGDVNTVRAQIIVSGTKEHTLEQRE